MKALMMLSLLLFVMGLAGCSNTMEGIGQDLEQLSDDISKKVDEVTED